MKHGVKYLWCAALLLGACNDDTTGPGELTEIDRVAYVVPGAAPMLFLQDSDGTDRTRIQFDGAEDRIPGNVSQAQLPVTDAQVKAIGAVKWSPDGAALAVVLTLAYDQSQIVVVDMTDGRARTASPNSQIILSDIAWSPDGKRIAYTMSTLPHATGIDVFVTDLERNTVRRITTGENLWVAGVELAWSADGRRLYWTRQSGEQDADGVFNAVTTVYGYDLDTGARTIPATGLVGSATGLALDAKWVLLVRNTAFEGGEFERELVRQPLPGGAASVLVPASGHVVFAELSPRQCSALVVLDVSESRQTPAFLYGTMPIRGGSVTPLLQQAGDPGSMDAFFSREDC